MTHHTSEQLFDGVKTHTFVGSGTGHRWSLWVQGAELLRFCPEQFRLAGLLPPWVLVTAIAVTTRTKPGLSESRGGPDA